MMGSGGDRGDPDSVSRFWRTQSKRGRCYHRNKFGIQDGGQERGALLVKNEEIHVPIHKKSQCGQWVDLSIERSVVVKRHNLVGSNRAD